MGLRILLQESETQLEGGIRMRSDLGVDINTAYGNLRAATEEHYIAQGQYNAARAEYGTARVMGLAKGEIQGKNADLRKASELEVLYDEKAELFVRETAMHLARLQYELAQVDVKWVGMRLRMEELREKEGPTDQAGLEADPD